MSQLKALEKMLTTENEKMAAALATDMNRPGFESETFEVPGVGLRLCLSNWHPIL